MTYEQIVGELTGLRLVLHAMLNAHPDPSRVRAHLAVLFGERQVGLARAGAGLTAEAERNAVEDFLRQLDALVAQAQDGLQSGPP